MTGITKEIAAQREADQIVDERQRLVAALRDNHVGDYEQQLLRHEAADAIEADGKRLATLEAALRRTNEPKKQERAMGFRDGARWLVTKLHTRGDEMNDPHARAVLNAAAFQFGNDLAALASPSEGQGWQKALVDRFLTWRLPMSVRSDVCVTKAYWEDPHWALRTGTNLLTADEARQMIEYLLEASPRRAE